MIYQNSEQFSLNTPRSAFYLLKPTYLINAIKHFLINHQGIVAVEMAIMIPFFLLLFFAIFNLCFLFYLIAAIDLAVVESGKLASVSDKKYEEIFKKNLLKDGSLWSFFIDIKKATFDISYCQTIDELTNNTCAKNPVEPESYPLVLYEIKYNYLPLMFAEYFSLNIRVKDVYIQGDKANGLSKIP